MLAYDWPDMDAWALVLLGESKTAEYRALIESEKDQESRPSSSEGTI